MTSASLNDARSDDRNLITAVMHRYCHMARENADFAGMAVIYTPTARIRLPDGTEVGANDMKEVVKGSEPNFIRHHVTTLDIQFRGEREADVTTMYLAITDQAAPDHWGEWRDHFVKQDDGRWLIDRRAIHVDGAAPGGWCARQYDN
jgi:hypothetical protein